MKLIILILCLVIFCDAGGDNEVRKLSMKLNPGCLEQLGSCDTLTLLHIEADADNDTIHYIWDFTGIPSLFLARTELNTTLTIDWNSFMEGHVNSVNFSAVPNFVFSAVVSRILVFDDPEDHADVESSSVKSIRSFNPHSFTWNRQNITQSEDQVSMMMNSSISVNGSFAIKLSAFGSTNHGDELPHLYHSSHSMQFDLIVDKISMMNYTSPRVAVEFLIVSSENKTEGSFRLTKRRNLDDEFTPGIFDVFDIVSPRSHNNVHGSFMQYRPVCYTSKERTVSGSTELKQGEIHDFNNNQAEIEKFKYTLPFSFYGYGLGARIAQGMNITFGLRGDGFYSRSQYVSFSSLLGVGHPPVEKLSVFVLTFIFLGLGLPLLMLLIGGTYVAVKRYRN